MAATFLMSVPVVVLFLVLQRYFVRALTDHAFTTLGAERVWLDASGENPRAQHLYDKAGYRREGVLRQSRRVQAHAAAHGRHGGRTLVDPLRRQ